MNGLSVLAVEDEAPSLDELTFLLRRSSLVERVTPARSADEALHLLQEGPFDLVLLDIRMPGLSGLELARVLARFSDPPVLAFVTAHEEHALEAFDVGAAGYLLKPVDERRLRHLLSRVAATPGDPRVDPANDEMVAVVSRGSTKLLGRAEVSWAEAAGDYVRLHTGPGHGYLLRLPMTTLEEQWSEHGFVRIHRSYLVALRAVREIVTEGSHTTVRLADCALPVSRRHVRELRERLVKGARAGLR